MKAVLLTRYPRVDTPVWKRQLAQGLLDSGIEVAVLYTRSRLRDQLEAGLKEFGVAASALKFVKLTRGSGGTSPQQTPSTEPLGTWAAERGLDVSHFDRLGDTACLEKLRSLSPDLLVLAGADIVPRATLEIPASGTINAHYGLLPAYRGMNVTEWSVYHDDPVGVTVHLVDPGIDTGDILLQETIAVDPGDDLEALRVKHQQLAGRLLLEAARQIATGKVDRRPQRAGEGRQYYRMHPALRAVVERKLASGDYRGAGMAGVSASA